jgi:hypothetical protein
MRKESSAAEDRMEKEWEKRNYFSVLMHEFILNEWFPFQEKIRLVEMIRRMDVLPAEVVDYRLRCLKGEDPGAPPDSIFDYKPTSWFNFSYPRWTSIIRGRDVGRTPEEVIAGRSRTPSRLGYSPASDLRGFIGASKDMMRSYFESGADRLYPEYASIWEAEKIGIREMQESIDRRAKAALRRRRTDRTVDFTA